MLDTSLFVPQNVTRNGGDIPHFTCQGACQVHTVTRGDGARDWGIAEGRVPGMTWPWL